MALNAYLKFYNKVTGGAASGLILPVGETPETDVTHKNMIQVKEFSFGVENKATIGSATSGAGGGKAVFNEFVIKKKVDSASPQLFGALATGAHYDGAVLYLRKSSASVDYLMYYFGLVFITAIDWSATTADDAPEEVVKLGYGSLRISYAQQTTSGGLARPAIMTWNQVTNTNQSPEINAIPSIP